MCIIFAAVLHFSAVVVACNHRLIKLPLHLCPAGYERVGFTRNMMALMSAERGAQKCTRDERGVALTCMACLPTLAGGATKMCMYGIDFNKHRGSPVLAYIRDPCPAWAAGGINRQNKVQHTGQSSTYRAKFNVQGKVKNWTARSWTHENNINDREYVHLGGLTSITGCSRSSYQQQCVHVCSSRGANMRGAVIDLNAHICTSMKDKLRWQST